MNAMGREAGMSLRKITEFEGSGKPITDFPGLVNTTEQRVFAAMLVRNLYRPARALLRSAQPDEQSKGRLIMWAFSNACGGLGDVVKETDEALYALLHHHMATAAGLGDFCIAMVRGVCLQNTMNRGIWETIKDKQRDADLEFVYLKAFFGLMENEDGFTEGITLKEWHQSVVALQVGDYPDFAGRAVRLVSEIKSRGSQDFSDEDLEKLLKDAAEHQPSKLDQRRDAALLHNKSWPSKPVRVPTV